MMIANVSQGSAFGLSQALRAAQEASEEIANQTERFLPVGWCWRAGASTATSVCEMVGDETPGDTGGYAKHKMLNGS